MVELGTSGGGHEHDIEEAVAGVGVGGQVEAAADVQDVQHLLQKALSGEVFAVERDLQLCRRGAPEAVSQPFQGGCQLPLARGTSNRCRQDADKGGYVDATIFLNNDLRISRRGFNSRRLRSTRCARSWQASGYPHTLNTGLTFLDLAPSIGIW
jgi:hypothetical protein